MRRGTIPQDDGWNGRLGHYQRTLRAAAIDLERHPAKERERHRGRYPGRWACLQAKRTLRTWVYSDRGEMRRFQNRIHQEEYGQAG